MLEPSAARQRAVFNSSHAAINTVTSTDQSATTDKACPAFGTPDMHSAERSLRILHVITGLWRHTGGPSESVPALCAGLCRHGARVTLATLDGQMATAVSSAEAQGVRVCRFPPSWRHSIWYSRHLANALPDLVARHDVVHVHGMWQYPGWRAADEARRQDRPLVISPRGSLLPKRLRKSAWKKRIAAQFRDKPLLTSAAVAHATSDAEAEAVRQFGYRGPIAVIPNGIGMPPVATDAERAAARRWFEARHPEVSGRRILLFMSRIEPTKGAMTLAKAWTQLAPLFPDWTLIIAGPDERGHANDVVEVLTSGGVASRTVLAGPLYDDDRESGYLAAELFVLPTESENFGMVIAEALAHRVPVVTTHGAPWRDLVTKRCGWWVKADLEHVREALATGMALPADELQRMGVRGQEWIGRAYCWDTVAAQAHAVYAWSLGAGPRPPYLRIDH
jgi:glycosyltransferase involved in cell wall biosynthesis